MEHIQIATNVVEKKYGIDDLVVAVTVWTVVTGTLSDNVPLQIVTPYRGWRVASRYGNFPLRALRLMLKTVARQREGL